MTTPKVLTEHKGGSRWYINPDTGEQVPGVTSIINMLPKPFLAPWNAKLVAQEAVADLELVRRMAVRDEAGAVDYLKGAPRRYTSKRAAIGTAAHGIFEALALGQPLGPVSPEIEPFVRQYADFLNVVQPEFLLCEETVWSDTHGYAGSFDAMAKVQGEGCVIDNKTSKDAHAETALQLSAYAHADFVLGADGSHQPVPEATHGLIVHVRPEKWAVYDVPIGEWVFEHFLSLIDVFKWDVKSRKVLGKPTLQGSAAA